MHNSTVANPTNYFVVLAFNLFFMISLFAIFSLYIIYSGGCWLAPVAGHFRSSGNWLFFAAISLPILFGLIFIKKSIQQYSQLKYSTIFAPIVIAALMAFSETLINVVMHLFFIKLISLVFALYLVSYSMATVSNSDGSRFASLKNPEKYGITLREIFFALLNTVFLAIIFFLGWAYSLAILGISNEIGLAVAIIMPGIIFSFFMLGLLAYLLQKPLLIPSSYIIRFFTAAIVLPIPVIVDAPLFRFSSIVGLGCCFLLAISTLKGLDLGFS